MKVHSNSNSLETAQVATNYPYGRLHCSMFFFVEYKPSKGWRAVTQSINPKNGRLNKPHAGTYSRLPIVIVEKEDGFFEFEYCPEMWSDKGAKFQAFVTNFFSDLSDNIKTQVKGFYDAAKKFESYKDIEITFPASDAL